MREKYLFAAFEDRDDADQAVDDLMDAGFERNEISVIARQEREEKKGRHEEEKGMAREVAEAAGTGATTGAIIGGLAGLLAGLVGIVIIGPIAALLGIGGVLAATVNGIVLGLAAGALAGALIELGIEATTARRYEEIVQAGGVVLAVPVEADEEADVRDMLEKDGATDLADVMVDHERRNEK